MPHLYVPLWCQSNHSFLAAASHPDELILRAAELGLPACTIADRDSLGGIVAAYAEIKRMEHAPRLIIGATLTVVDRVDGPSGNPALGAASGRRAAGGRAAAPTSPASGATTPGAVVVLAATAEGYSALSSAITSGRLRSPKGSSRLTVDELVALVAHQGVLAIWTRSSGDRQRLEALAQVAGDRLYVGISRHARAGDARDERRLLADAQACGLPMVALPHVLYHVPERRELHDVLTCIRERTTLDAAGTLLLPNDTFAMPTPAEMARRYADHPDWLAATIEIADRCTFSLGEISYRYPSERRPDGYTDIGWLRDLTRRGAERRYPEGTPPEVVRQLERELDLIEELDYSGYFLTMSEIVTWCRSRGIICQGRGSAANSSVCYCLGITAVDPVRMNLLFERFLSRERAEPPDIDLDIEHRRREEVIAHVYERYGRDHAAMVANVVRFRRRSAAREVGLVFGFAATALDQLARLLSQRGLAIGEALADTPLDPASPRVAAFVRATLEILDTPRHLSIHPGGFLLGRDPVHTIVPVEHATMPGRTVVQWDKYAIEEMNLFKVDLLGLGALTHLDYAFRLIADHLGHALTLATIPAVCPMTFAMLQRGDTVGVFQLESRAQMSMLPRLRPEEFYDLVVEISIVRPGPITGGMVHPYLRRRHGIEPIEYAHPDLAPVLERTLGVPLFQEQVMKLAVVAADYTPGEADQLRRDMAAWRRTGRIEQHQTRIIERMTARGIEREFAERVFEQIRGFGEYGFPESHAASFALIAWATAWMRAHYPVVFTCALLNAWPMGFYSPATIVGDARRTGVRVLPVDITRSGWECTLEPSNMTPAAAHRPHPAPPAAARRPHPASPAAAHRPHPASPAPRATPATEDADFAVRMGLRYVHGLGEDAGQRLVSVRDRLLPRPDAQAVPATGDRRSRRPVRHTTEAVGDARDLLGRLLREARIDRDQAETLARAGAFVALGIDRRDALWEVLGARRAGRADTASVSVAAPAAAAAAPAAALDRLLADWREAPPSLTPLDPFEAVAWDYLSSGHSTSAHPLEPFREWLAQRAYPSAAEVGRVPAGATTHYIGMVICRQRPETASGTLFMTLEDETGFVNLVVWKRRFEELRTVLVTGSFLGVRGVVQREEGVTHLIVEQAWHAELPHAPQATGSRDFH